MARSPRLDTILMVESCIRQNSGEFSKRELWGKLPKKVMYQTFSLILEYLLYSRKVAINAERKFVWIHIHEDFGGKNE